MAEIKKVIQRIYNFDLKDCSLSDGNEMISTDHGSEFVNTFIKRDLDKSLIITPGGYQSGLVYKSTNGGEFYNNPEWMPDIVNFSFNFYGLKKGSFYRITIKARNSRKYNSLIDITDNRQLEVSNSSQELLINEDLTDVMANQEFVGIFRANRIEEDIYFSIGKIYINDIIVDEVEITKDEEVEKEEVSTIEFDSGKSNIVAYAVFSSDFVNKKGRYYESERITGKGLSLFYDINEHVYILERDNYEDSIGTSFTASNYIVDINFNKAPYACYTITDISADTSPNTIKQGFLKFRIDSSAPLTDKDKKVEDEHCYTHPNGRLCFIITKVN